MNTIQELWQEFKKETMPIDDKNQAGVDLFTRQHEATYYIGAYDLMRLLDSIMISDKKNEAKLKLIAGVRDEINYFIKNISDDL